MSLNTFLTSTAFSTTVLFCFIYFCLSYHIQARCSSSRWVVACFSQVCFSVPTLNARLVSSSRYLMCSNDLTGIGDSRIFIYANNSWWILIGKCSPLYTDHFYDNIFIYSPSGTLSSSCKVWNILKYNIFINVQLCYKKQFFPEFYVKKKSSIFLPF